LLRVIAIPLASNVGSGAVIAPASDVIPEKHMDDL
jgi:hypothetical protein